MTKIEEKSVTAKQAVAKATKKVATESATTAKAGLEKLATLHDVKGLWSLWNKTFGFENRTYPVSRLYALLAKTGKSTDELTDFIKDNAIASNGSMKFAVYLEVCFLLGAEPSIESFRQSYVCTEDTSNRAKLLPDAILADTERLGLDYEGAAAVLERAKVRRANHDALILELLRTRKANDYDAAVKMANDSDNATYSIGALLEVINELDIYECNYTTDSAVKDFVYFKIAK